MTFELEGANLYTCQGQDALSGMGLTDDNAQEALLPATMAWYLDGTLEEAVSRAHAEPTHMSRTRAALSPAVPARR